MNYSDFLMLRNGEGVFDFLEYFDFSMPFLFCKIKTMNICLFSREEIFSPLSIKDARAQHLIKILHKKIGDSFSAGIVNGSSGTAEITDISDEALSFRFTPNGDGKCLFPLIMIVGFPRPIQLKRLLRDVAAIGAKEIHLTGTELGEKSYMQSNLVAHGTAYKMLLDGTVQAASTHVPELFMHKTLAECVEALENRKDFSEYLKFCLDNANPTRSLVSAMENNKIRQSPLKTFVAAIGSERGWTGNERIFLEKKGFLRCGMGNRTMRTETAATVCAGIISAYAGWLEN